MSGPRSSRVRLLFDPLTSHERAAERSYGVKSAREIDDDQRVSADLYRASESDRPRIRGSWLDGTAPRDMAQAGAALGLWIDGTDVDPLGDVLPYENNSGPVYRGVKPSIAAGAAASSGGSFSLTISEGVDRVGRITLIPGTAPTTGILATITFAVPLPTAAYAVRFDPADSDASGAAGRSVYSSFSTQDETSFEMLCSTALVAGTSYQWWYSVIPFIEL